MAENPEEMLKTLAHEELGLSDQAFQSPWRSAASATVSTAVGAAVPVLPYLFIGGAAALITSFVISTLAHFAVGGGKGCGHGAHLVEERPRDDVHRAGRSRHHLRHRAADIPLAWLSDFLICARLCAK
jgi:hypothetical protein